MVTNVAGTGPEGLPQLLAVEGGRFGTVVLANCQSLIGVERTAPAAVESYRIGVDHIASRRPRQGEFIAALFPARQVIPNQISGRGIGRPGRRRAKLR